MRDRVSLAKALEGYFDKDFKKLPNALKDRVGGKVDPEKKKRVGGEFPISWDKLSPGLRRSLASEIDAVNGHGNKQAPEDLILHRLALEEEIAVWEAAGTPTAIDIEIKKKHLADLKPKLAAVQNKIELARGDYLDLGDEAAGEKLQKPDGHLNHDPEYQEMANRIAIEQMAATFRPITRNKVAAILAKELGKNEDTVLRRIRKRW